jgi:hypothetical protein
MSFKNPEGQTASWIQRLQEYNFTYQHCQGRKKKQRRCSLKTTLPREMYALPQSRDSGRRKASTSYCSSTRRRLGSAGSENGTAKWHRHRAHSAGSKNRTTTGVERHRRPESHVQNLLDSVEIARCEKQHTRAQLGIGQRTIPSSPNSYSSEESKERADRTTRWTVRRSPGCQRNPEQGSATVLLAPGKKRYLEMVPTVRRLCGRPPHQE